MAAIFLLVAILLTLSCQASACNIEKDDVPIEQSSLSSTEVSEEHLMETFSLIANRLEELDRRLKWVENRLTELEYKTANY